MDCNIGANKIGAEKKTSRSTKLTLFTIIDHLCLTKLLSETIAETFVKKEEECDIVDIDPITSSAY